MPFSRIFLSPSQTRLLRSGTGIYCYHYLGTRPRHSNDPYLYVAAQEFRRQLSALKDAGFTSIRLAAVVAAATPVANQVVISVDDGAQNFFEQGLGILNEFGFQAIQFIVAGQIGGINEWDAKHGYPVVPLMDDAQIREWLAAGHEIGSHSLTHRNLTKLGAAEARTQIMDSKKLLEDRFGVAVRHFCYPHGRFNVLTQALVVEAGYETACSTRFGVNGPAGDPYALRRIAPLAGGELCGKVCHRLWRKIGLAR